MYWLKMTKPITDFILNTQEYGYLGYNMLTLWFLISVVLVATELWGLSCQITTLRSEKAGKAEGISVVQKLILATYFFTGFNYALEIKSLGLCLALLIGLLQLLIILNLWHLKRFSKLEWGIVFLCTTVVVCSFSIPFLRTSIFIVTAFALIPGLTAQPIKMMVKKTAEGLNPRDPFSFLLSSVFWIFYGLMLNSRAISVTSSAYACTYIATLILWFKYKSN